MVLEEWFIIVFSLAVAGWTFLYRLNEQKKYRAAIETLCKREAFQLYDFSKPYKYGYGTCVVLGLVFAGIGIVEKNGTSIGIGIVLAGVFAGEYCATDKRYRLFHNETSVVIGEEKVDFRSIKAIERISRIPFAWKRLTTYGGKAYRISPKSAQYITDWKNAYAKRKKK